MLLGLGKKMKTEKIQPGYTERAKMIQATQNYSLSSWVAALNLAHVREPTIWTLSVVSEILMCLREQKSLSETGSRKG